MTYNVFGGTLNLAQSVNQSELPLLLLFGHSFVEITAKQQQAYLTDDKFRKTWTE